MSGIQNFIELIDKLEKQNDNDLIIEARHDDNFKQAIIGIKNITASSPVSDQYNRIVDTMEKVFKKIISSSGFKLLPSSWKLLVSDMAILSMISSILDEITENSDSDNIKVGKLKQKFDKLTSKNDDLKNIASFHLIRYVELLYHYNGIAYQKIKDANPYKSTESFLTVLSRLERDFTSLSEELIEINGDEELILDMGEYKWYLLDRESCSAEGNAMGHCGNAGSPKSGDQILSLRRVIKHNGIAYFRPSLTFIINNGILGEMKGRANNKPNSKYHPYIMGLLKLPFIKGIRGGGYKPEANFDVSDLTDEQRAELSELKGSNFLLRYSAIAEINKLYIETGQFTHSMLTSLEEELYEVEDLSDNGKLGIMNDKLVYDLESIIEDTGYKGYVFGDEYLELEVDIIEDFDEYLRYLKSTDYDLVIQYIVDNYEGDIKEYMEEEYGNSDDYGLLFVRNNVNEIITSLDIEPVKNAIQDAHRHASESGTMAQMFSTMRDALIAIQDDYGISIPTNIYELVDEYNFQAIIEPKNFLKFANQFVDSGGEVHLDFEEPYYGFYAFDEDYFRDSALKEQLIEQDVLEYNPKDNENTQNPT